MNDKNFITSLALELTCEYIAESTGDCPLSAFDYEIEGRCGDFCDSDCTRCWCIYFENQAKEKKKETENWLNKIKER